MKLAEANLLKLDHATVKTFPLQDISECVKQARLASALQFMVLEPNG